MGFTAKNLTKLQPKKRVFSTDYKSQTGSGQTAAIGITIWLALGIAMEIFCEATNKRLQWIARPVRGTPKNAALNSRKDSVFAAYSA
jgi:hypothetical protein